MREEEWDNETRISAREYHGILQDYCFKFYLKFKSTISSQNLFEIMETKNNVISYCSKKKQWKNQVFFNSEARHF
jgi:hypothetical protein